MGLTPLWFVLSACERSRVRPFAAQSWDELAPHQQAVLLEYDRVRSSMERAGQRDA